MTAEGITHQTLQYQRVCCPDCVLVLVVLFLAIHRQVKDSIRKGGLGPPPGRTLYLLGLLTQVGERGGLPSIGMYRGGA